MSESSLRLDAYLERIRYDGPLSPSIETLCRLHRAQVMNIPFENLDLFLGRSIQLDSASLMSKLVEGRRGGYCYELNGLFLMVLQRLGFSVTPLAGRVFSGDTLLRPGQHQVGAGTKIGISACLYMSASSNR